MRLYTVLILSGSILIACTSIPQYERSGMCAALNTYAQSIPNGETRNVKLSVTGRWLVDHDKACGADQSDLGGQEFCEWLIENTSTEFMEANINQALSCLQGQTIIGYIGNTGISGWKGSTTFHSPRIETESEITLHYDLGSEEVFESYIVFEVHIPTD